MIRRAPFYMMAMNDDDEAELHRLCDSLEGIDRRVDLSDVEHEALKKAALALHHLFLNGSRATIEDYFDSLGAPLTEPQREHLRTLGMDPESNVA